MVVRSPFCELELPTRSGLIHRQSAIFASVRPCPHRPDRDSGRFAKGHVARASFLNFLAPGFAGAALQILMATGLAEVALCLWLLIMGVNVQRWQELRGVADGSARTPS